MGLLIDIICNCAIIFFGILFLVIITLVGYTCGIIAKDLSDIEFLDEPEDIDESIIEEDIDDGTEI